MRLYPTNLLVPDLLEPEKKLRMSCMSHDGFHADSYLGFENWTYS